MAQDSSNPFVLPGFGQQGDAAHNPVFAGLEMMRQAWQNMAGAGGGGLDAAPLTAASAEDLDRRIRELQTVQNWLQLNATMLANTIQGLEIQRSTLNTLKSFAGGAFPGAAAAGAAAQPDAGGADYARAAGDWWNLVQQQFAHLADAATAGLQGMAESAPPAKTAAARKKPAARKTAAPSKKPAARKTAAQKSTAKKTTARRARS